jgi:large repetitive protein
MLQATNVEGQFIFPDMPLGGSYKLSGLKNDDYLNGVSTLDLVVIQRHILGIEKIKSPYLMIAADINNDKKITASDLVELRKLILGSNDKFSNNTSWRFIDKGFTFPDPSNPLNGEVKETYDITQLAADMNIDFVAVKTGDVNGSAIANVTSNNAENRSNNTLNLATEAKAFAKGETFTMDLNTENATSLSGLQFTLKFNPAMVELKDINGLDIDLNDNNLGMTRINDGIITFSWNKDNSVDVSQLLKLTFLAKQDGNTSDLLNINSALTKAEAYNQDLDVMNIAIRSVASENGFDLYQNTPNPFSATTSISFTIPQASNVNFKIYDVTGKVLKLINKDYTAGTHTITIDKTQLGQSGVLYYQLKAGQNIATKKMVVIE